MSVEFLICLELVVKVGLTAKLLVLKLVLFACEWQQIFTKKTLALSLAFMRFKATCKWPIESLIIINKYSFWFKCWSFFCLLCHGFVIRINAYFFLILCSLFVRFSKKNLVVWVRWQGKAKPAMSTFLTPFLVSAQSLRKKSEYYYFNCYNNIVPKNKTLYLCKFFLFII